MLTGNAEPSYKMHLEFYQTDGGTYIHEEPLHEADFERARLAACWDGFWTGRFPDYEPGKDSCRIEPVFADPDGGSPRAVGFFVAISTVEGDVHRVAFEVGHFQRRARRTASELVQLG